MHILRNFWQKYSNYTLLAILIAIITLITYYRVMIQIDMGPISDSCDFLSNALFFAGQNTGYFDSTRPPFFSFLTSLIFKAGFISTNVIFILDGLFYIIGVIGMFFLLKLRFKPLQSFLGALLYSTFPIVITIMGIGFSDLASVSITIWTFYFLILAVKKDSIFFFLVFPLAMLAFLTRYNNILIIFPIFLYILINKDKIKGFENMIIGMITSFLFIIPVLIFFYQKFGDPIFPFTAPFKMTSSTHILSVNAAYDSNSLFFIDKFPSFIGLEGVLTLLIILAGFFIFSILKFRQKSDDKRLSNLKITNKKNKLKLILLIVLTLVFLLSFNNILVYYSEILFFIWTYLIYDLAKNLNKNLDMHLLFLSWFMTFFIFHSIFTIKDNRYFIVMAPSVAYFLLLGLTEVSKRLKIKIKNTNATFPIIAIFLIVLIIFSTASYLPTILPANGDNTQMNEKIVNASQWLVNYDKDYKNKIIYADYWPNFSWYLKTNVKMMPVFKDGQIFYGGVKEFNLTPEDNRAYNKELDDNNASYYFCIRPGLNLTNYEPVKQFGNLIIYEKKTDIK